MTDAAASVARSFRLSKATADLLDRAAASSPESRNALADRLLGEALRAERHPLIQFRTGAAGFREPVIIGTRIKVRQLISTFLAEGRSIDATADYYSVPPLQVRAAVAYYAEFQDEIDSDIEQALVDEAAEFERWEREQAVLG